MMPNRLPGQSHGAPPRSPQPRNTAALHERLFGDDSAPFYIGISICLGLSALPLVHALLSVPARITESLGALAIPLFFLLQGSPDLRVKSVALAIMGGLLWSHVDNRILVVMIGSSVTGALYYVSETNIERGLDRLATLRRTERAWTVVAVAGATATTWALLAVPGGGAIYSQVAAKGHDPLTATIIVAVGAGLLAYVLQRQLRDRLPSPPAARARGT